jgi:hypothetical protein
MNIPNISAHPKTRMEISNVIILGILATLTIPALYFLLPVGLDWRNTYRPAALAMLAGKSPYSVEIFYAAPWSLIPLLPFAVLPYSIGRLGVFILGLMAFAYIPFKLHAKPPALIIFLLSAAVIGCLNNGNIEWMPMLGILLPPQIGLIFLAVKPQVGIGLGLFWIITILRDTGIKETIKVCLPVTTLTIISFALYGFWPLRFNQTLAWSMDNTSLGLYGYFIGACILLRSIRRNNSSMALAAGPFLSPYVLQFTWASVLIYLLNKPAELLAAVILLWMPVLLRVFS